MCLQVTFITTNLNKGGLKGNKNKAFILIIILAKALFVKKNTENRKLQDNKTKMKNKMF